MQNRRQGASQVDPAHSFIPNVSRRVTVEPRRDDEAPKPRDLGERRAVTRRALLLTSHGWLTLQPERLSQILRYLLRLINPVAVAVSLLPLVT